MKIYISGKISGLPLEVSRLNFSVCERNLQRIGLDVINPMSKKYWKNRIFKLPWIVHMFCDILLLFQCQGIFFQSNWKESRGARIERKFAKMFGLVIVNELYLESP